MGIPGLWKLLEPVAEKRSFHHFCVEEGFLQNEAADGRGLRVGIDALGWVYPACYRHSCTKNLELATLNTRCNRLVQLPIHPLFVFDGPDRPRRKRGKHVQGNPHWIEQDFKLMLDAFGFAWIDACGEAESELASLSKRGFLDAVLTEDSDTIVFGAKTVIRFDSDVSEDEQVILYKAEDIEKHPCLALTTAGLMLIALLVGGDYDPGIKNCGIETAFRFACAGFGDNLLHAITSYPGNALDIYLEGWRARLCHEAITNSSSKLSRCCPALAKNMPSDFPRKSILFAYYQPLISKAEPPCLCDKLPSPPLLARFAEEHFVWGDLIGILNHFSDTVFPGLALWILMAIARARDLGLHNAQIHSLVGKVLLTRNPSSIQKCERSPEFQMQLNIPKEMIDEIADTIHGRVDKEILGIWISKKLPRLRAWVPVAVKQVIG